MTRPAVVSAAGSAVPTPSRQRQGTALRSEIVRLTGSRQEAIWIIEDASREVAAGAAPGTCSEPGDEPIAARALAMARRRAAGEPLQHVLGHWSFRALDVAVDGRALVPRPETEMVAGAALLEARRLVAARPATPLRAADLGTGSGVIACSLAVELTGEILVHATDVSPEALSLAEENVRRTLGDGLASRVRLCLGSWFAALPGEARRSLDLVVSNPPYLAEDEWAVLAPVVRDHDPYLALVAGPSGTEAIDQIVDGAVEWLAPGGALVLELAPAQAAGSLDRAGRAGYSRAEVRKDLAGQPRILVAHR